MTKLEKLVDDYGKCNDALKELTEQKESIRKELEKLDLENGNFLGEKYTLVISEAAMKVYDLEKAKKALGKNFMDCISLQVTKVKEYLIPTKIEELVSEVNLIKRYSIKKE